MEMGEGRGEGRVEGRGGEGRGMERGRRVRYCALLRLSL